MVLFLPCGDTSCSAGPVRIPGRCQLYSLHVEQYLTGVAAGCTGTVGATGPQLSRSCLFIQLRICSERTVKLWRLSLLIHWWRLSVMCFLQSCLCDVSLDLILPSLIMPACPPAQLPARPEHFPSGQPGHSPGARSLPWSICWPLCFRHVLTVLFLLGDLGSTWCN